MLLAWAEERSVAVMDGFVWSERGAAMRWPAAAMFFFAKPMAWPHGTPDDPASLFGQTLIQAAVSMAYGSK